MPYVDFKNLKEQVSIAQAAEKLNLKLKGNKGQLRGVCPACNKGDDRSLAITPERGLFYCFQAREGGDCLALVQHVTGLDLKDAAEFLAPHAREDHGSPQPSAGKERAPAKKETAFDAEAFAAKLAYGDEVKALGITEDQARQLGVGTHRGRLYFALRYPSGVTAGYQYVEDGKAVFPKSLLPDAAPPGVVVAFPKRA